MKCKVLIYHFHFWKSAVFLHDIIKLTLIVMNHVRLACWYARHEMFITIIILNYSIIEINSYNCTIQYTNPCIHPQTLGLNFRIPGHDCVTLISCSRSILACVARPQKGREKSQKERGSFGKGGGSPSFTLTRLALFFFPFPFLSTPATRARSICITKQKRNVYNYSSISNALRERGSSTTIL